MHGWNQDKVVYSDTDGGRIARLQKPLFAPKLANPTKVSSIEEPLVQAFV
jgi:hypothetical protein